MKRKAASGIMMTLVLLSMLTLAFGASVGDTLYAFGGATEGTMRFEPANVTGLNIDDTFTLVVTFADFTDLYTWQVEIGFDPTVLMVVDFQGGPILPDSVFKVLAPGRTTLWMPGAIDNTLGYIYYSAESLTGAGGVTGTAGTGYKLMRIGFKVKGGARTGSEVYLDRGLKTFWVDAGGVKKYPATQVATITTVGIPPAYSPTAKFSWTPVIPKEGETITFDASISKSGFDGASVRPITEYRWDFDGVPGWEVVAPTPITTWSYPAAGYYPVTLEVYAPGAYPLGVPDTHSIIKTVQVIPPPLGAAVDVYTQKTPFNGVGPDVPSDAFAPQELVILYAFVTYNDDPVSGKLVAFQVIDSAGENVLYRTATTDVDGIAMINFRIPNSPALGVWQVIAIGDVVGTLAADTLTFKVGWIIELLSVTPGVTSYTKGQTATFTLEIQSISMATKMATLTILIYDDAGVPINKLVIPDWSIEGGFVGPMDVSINIPMWAFVDSANVYANAFTALPTHSGVPYCPEASAQFIIEKP